MDATKRKALETAGWKVGDAADSLELSDEERQRLDARVQRILADRKQRVLEQSSPEDLRNSSRPKPKK